MKTFTMVLDYYHDDFEISIEMNHTYTADDVDSAIDVARELEKMNCFSFKPYYDKAQGLIVLNKINNECFDDVFVSNYIFYDQSRGDYLHHDLENGTTLYPVVNPVCFVEMNMVQFINSFERKNKDILLSKDKIYFDSSSFGVREVNI
ncbi:hypothetical protein [Cytobacillus purgationiresistens]|uniref:Uncharacterized protein n=1 Tax=Cytobacillus purgationiresistens TaxID=863449 RepID=A0ABU0AI87_9BACI|nr:hypothetical protein [Cytobacillus purgationiresistens]MDQ0270968.1 hypothetical protein [Cytobacillus purgationiresistens]